MTIPHAKYGHSLKTCFRYLTCLLDRGHIKIGCLARIDLNLPSNRFELFWVTKLFSYLVQSLLAYLHCFSALCAVKLPSLS